MNDFTSALAWAIRIFAGWIAPLGILAYMFVFALRLLRDTESPEARLAARGGLVVGLAIWVFIVYRFPPASVVAGLSTPTSDWWAFLFCALPALLAGFGFMYLVERWAHTSAVGVLILVLAATSTTAAYSYVFASSSRDVLLTTSLFLLMGAGSRVIKASRKLVDTIFRRDR